jgi:gliding motility-associated-like protein
LPTTSNNGISGAWSPALNNQQTTTYTFTPSSGQCAYQTTMTITVYNNDTYFDTIAICSNNLPFLWNGQSLMNPTNTSALLQNQLGCDSTVYLNFQVIPIQNVLLNEFVCQNELPFLWDGDAFFDAGAYTKSYIGQNGCDSIVTLNLTILEIPTVSFEMEAFSGCLPIEITFVNSNIEENSSATWSFGNGTSSTNVIAATTTYYNSGCYDVTFIVTNQNGCTTTQLITDYICLQENPIAAFILNENHLTSINPVVQINNTSQFFTTAIWQFGDGTWTTNNNAFLQHTYLAQSGSYYINHIVTNDNGCIDSTTQFINIITQPFLYIPNAFTPNGSNMNEIFQPVVTEGVDVSDYNLLIFNRWGELIFESKHYKKGWDGTYGGQPAPEGVYTYQIEFKHSDYVEREIIRGHFSLLR